MTVKRWIAIVVAVALLFVSIGVNWLSFFFTRDYASFWDEVMAGSSTYYEEAVIEEGSATNRIAVLNLDGVILDTGSPLLSSTYNHDIFMSQLTDVLNDPSVKGVILQVNSPGGGVLESSDIYDAIRTIQEDKGIPFYVAMGGMAASGGYYVSAPADKIFVHPETITGSIGVIMNSMNYAKLAERFGIDFNTIKTGPYKDIMSRSREMTKEERAMLQEMVNDSYERFIQIIADGRGMSIDEVRKVADGRIMNGRQAIEAGLADDYGKVGDAIAAMKKELGLEKAMVFEYQNVESWNSLFGMKLQSLFGRDVETELISRILSDYNSPRMMYLYGEK